jgi:CRISPR-associated endonuclease Csn1
MLRAITTTQDRLGSRTVGQMFALDPQYAERKHNRGLNFDRSIQRSDHEDEVRKLFAAQRRLGNSLATETLQDAYTEKAFSQCPLHDSEDKVRACRFELGEKRTARRSYAFEMFRLLSRLTNLKLTARGEEWPLTAEQIARVTADFGRQKRISFKSLRKTLDLDPRVRFAGVAEKDEIHDVVARTGNVADGTKALRDVVGEAGWRVLMHAPAQRDRIAEVLTFREDPASIRVGLEETGVDGPILEAILAGVETGAFYVFKGAGHISAKAARALIPPLARGQVLHDACREVGYDPAEPGIPSAGNFLVAEGWRGLVPLLNEQVRNPVARKALSEMLKQVRALVRAYGLPDYIHVELARAIGKSADEREKITRGIDARNTQRDKLRKELADLIERDPTLEELVRYELLKEQNCRCLYTDTYISPAWIAEGDVRVQVDHILPWSRFGDDSFMNKTICTAQANQAKRGRTPFEWFHQDKTEKEWAEFAARVEGCKEMKSHKKRGFYLRKNAEEVEKRFRDRNLGDTRYATRLLLGLLAQLYPKNQEHVLARPGPLTAKLRRAWGLDDLKKDEKGDRLESDRHHALDAIVLAATSRSMLQRLTRAAQEAERKGEPRGFDFKYVPEPWAGFRDETRAVVEHVFVSRAERQRVRGEAHKATIKQIREVNGASVVFERKSVEKLTPKDLDNLEDPKKATPPVPYGDIHDPAKLRAGTIAALRKWIDIGKPKDAMPRSPKGDLIRKVRVPTGDKRAVEVRGGTADRGEMARVDVFSKANKRGKREFYLVPIYPHEVADREHVPTPPNNAVADAKSKSGWVPIDHSYEFLFCLYQNTLVGLITSDGQIIRGYFKGLDRNTGAIKLAPPENPRDLRTGIGARRLRQLTKLNVDRLGSVTIVHREVRTWHGEACT